VKEFAQKVYEQMPRVSLTDLLVEVASWTGFARHFTHPQTGEPAKDPEPVLDAVLADGTNLGLCKIERRLGRWLVSNPVPARPPRSRVPYH
jgi:hypothetical protein